MSVPVVRIAVLQTPPSLKIKLLPKPVVQVRALTQIPAQVSVVSTTTSDPGTNASVVNIGTPGNARLQFTIPRGDVGPQGATGAQGIQGETGPAGADSTVPGPPGADGVVQSLVAGSNITIDATDPANPIINSTASGSGDVVGPASAVDGTPAVFDGTTGKLIKNITYASFKTLLSLVKGDVGLGNVDNTSDATKNAAAVALTNKDLTSGTNTFPTLNQNTTGSAAKLTTARTIDGQSFDGTANITVIAPGTHAATGKTTPVDADEFAIVDSAASNVLKKLTWANLKAGLAAFVGDSGSGGTKGVVPAPAAGDAAAGKFLKANGSWAVPSGGSWSTYTPTISAQSGTITTASATGRYIQTGKIVIAEIDVIITTAGTGSLSLIVGLPVTAAAFNYVGVGFEYQNTGKSGALMLFGATLPNTANIRDASGSTFIASGNKVAMCISYEAA